MAEEKRALKVRRDAEEPRARKVPKATIEPLEPRKPAREPPPRRTPRQQAMLFLNSFVLTLIIFYFLYPEFQRGLTLGADSILQPLVGFNGQHPIATLLIAGVLTSSLSTIIAHFLTDYVRQARWQKISGELNRRRFAALRSGNMKKAERAAEQLAKHQQENSDLMWAPLKMMGYTMIVIFVIFSWMGHFVTATVARPENLGEAYFAVPWAPRVDLRAASVLPHWILLYSLLAIPFSLVLRRLLRYFTFKRRLEALDAGGDAAGSA